jgi:hypothetical protein
MTLQHFDRCHACFGNMPEHRKKKEQRMKETKKSLGCKLAAYSLAAGVAGLAGSASGSAVLYDNGGSGWFDARPHLAGGVYDMILFELDGTVLVDDAQIDPALPVSPSSIELMGESYGGQYNWGDGKSRDSAFLRLNNASVLGTYWSSAAEAAPLSFGTTVGATPPGGNYWVTGDAEGDVGLYGYGWYSTVGNFGGTKYFGFSMQDAGNNTHYGWAQINISGGRDQITLFAFGVETTPDTAINVGDGVPVPEPMTLSLLGLGAAGLVARRKRA